MRDFVQIFERMGCSAHLVRGSVTNFADITRAVDGAPTSIRGATHLGMVLDDRAFLRMTIGEWNCVTAPKKTGAWDLHAVSARVTWIWTFVIFSAPYRGYEGN